MIDLLSDNNLSKFHELSKKYLQSNIPDFLKSANLADERPPADAAASVFGDPVERKFPCHTKLATWLSSFYFLGQRYTEPWTSAMQKDHVEKRLEKAAKFWGIHPEIQKIKKLVMQKTAEPVYRLTDKDYALVANYGSEKIRRFPIINPITVKKAAANLYRYKVSYPYTWRKKAAINILKRAMELDVTLEPDQLIYLSKAAGFYPASLTHIKQKLQERINLYPDLVADRMRKVAETVEKQSQMSHSGLCELLDTIDRECKMYPMYNGGLSLPEDVCFTKKQLTKKASETVTLITGNSYNLDDIIKAGLSLFKASSVYAPAVVKDDNGELDPGKLKTTLPTMPLDDAKAFETMLKGASIQPVK